MSARLYTDCLLSQSSFKLGTRMMIELINIELEPVFIDEVQLFDKEPRLER